MEIDERFRVNIVLRRKELEFTQVKLARIANIDRSHVSNIERGKSVPSIIMVEKIAIALKSEISDLIAIKS